MPPVWTIDELRAALLTGTQLPGEPKGEPPWPRYRDDEYRRVTAANCLARDYGHDPEAIHILRSYITAGENHEVRCRCLTLLAEHSPLEELIDQLLDDPEPEIRLYALEYSLVNHPSRFPELEARFRGEQDSQVNETLECFRAGSEIPLYHYDIPANKATLARDETVRPQMDEQSSPSGDQ